MAAGDTGRAQQQIDEIEALSSIYGEDWCVVDEDEKIYCIKISDCLDQPKWTLCLQVILPPGYPTEEPPIYQLNAPWLRGQDYTELANSLEEIYLYSSGKTFIQQKALFHDLHKSDKKNSSIERQNLGESILYLWVEKIREVLIEKAQSSVPEPDIKKTTEEVDEDDGEDFVLDYEPIKEDPIKMLNYMTSESQEDEELPPIHHGNPITDRRSTFQAHLAPVVTTRQYGYKIWSLNPYILPGALRPFKFTYTVPHRHAENHIPYFPKAGIVERGTGGKEMLRSYITEKDKLLFWLKTSVFEVKRVLEKLYENKKIASATHNIYAYRIYCEDKQTFLQDCEDDGETAAGGRLLHLMQILNVHNVLVVVSRWYGGILLGPDRFKHINNCARNVLVEYDYVPSVEESSRQTGKSKKIRKDNKKRTEH